MTRHSPPPHARDKLTPEGDAQHSNLLKTKRNLLYISNQSVPRSKHFPPQL